MTDRSRVAARGLLAAALLVVGSEPASAQRTGRGLLTDDGPRTLAYLEVIGAGGLYSLNVERLTSPTTVLRVGATAWSLTNVDGVSSHQNALIGSVAKLIDLSPFVGRDNRWAEVGLGVVAGSNSHEQYGERREGALVAALGTVGLRYQNPDGGFMYRVTFTPFYAFASSSDLPEKGLFPSIGGSVGWLF